jgi:hypothetical protein
MVSDRVRRLVAEFLLIVAGVLTALTVDAWWQGHVERVREQEYLDQLLSDVLDNQRRLEEALGLERGQLQRAGAMLSALRGRDAILTDSAASWVNREPPFPWYSDPRLRDGTLVALVETGDINLIRDNRIRAATIGYLGQLRADLTEFSRGIEPFQNLAFQLIRLMELARTANSDTDRDEAARAFVALQGNPEAAVVLRLFRFNIESRMWYLNQMLEATKAFVAVLRP